MLLAIVVSLLAPATPQALQNSLLQAAWSGQSAAVRSALDSGRVDPNVGYRDGTTALMLASLAGHDDVVTLLIEAGADASASNEDGETALILASAYGFNGVAAQLIEAGADVNAVDSSNRSARTWADWGGNQRLVELLAASGAEVPTVLDPFDGGKPLTRFEKTPDMKKYRAPKLPKSLKKGSFDAEIVLRFVIDREGELQSIEIVEGYDEELDARVLEAAEKWRYEPAEVQGRPVEGVARATLKYYRGQPEPKVMTWTSRWRN